ncbi:RNA methyltransferase [Aquabacterium sp. A7-Y]|uniref:TrmH family RNA methyltransferase n=1 Tax=Aquabacterium sp. A7-Y TaxID=1349605 RepID=UPI00223E6332|nr:RNA methyltransferase [Aquabacterium sp. A7-Y]MCW7540308.1 RNA methyltransferase [Aquabacterium sp. A7-Y]
MQPRLISSRDNPLLVRLRKLAQDPGAYRKLGEIWVEGDHLCGACVVRGVPVAQAVLSETAWQQPALRRLAQHAPAVSVVPDALFKGVSGLESPTGCGFLLPWSGPVPVRPGVASVVLDRLQDAGNVGSVLRSAAALGVEQVIALRGTAGLWSPKVLRAGMGAHFALHIVETAEPAQLDTLALPLLGTSSHTEAELHATPLPWPCAWVLGHEGQGVDAALLSRCAQVLRIPQPGGEESLNVAAAAAVCLYESLRQRLAGGAQ